MKAKPKKPEKKIIPLDSALLQEPKLHIEQRHEYASERLYEIVNEKNERRLVPSVTTCLPSPPAFVLDRWENKVGREYAAQSLDVASRFGDRIDQSVERLIQKGLCYRNHIYAAFFDELAYIVGTQVGVASFEFGYAGTLDVLAMNKLGELTLFDIKTHGRVHNPEDEKTHYLALVGEPNHLSQEIQSHKKNKWKLQLGAYSQGLLETYGLVVERAEVWCFNVGLGCIVKPVDLDYDGIQKEFLKFKENI